MSQLATSVSSENVNETLLTTQEIAPVPAASTSEAHSRHPSFGILKLDGKTPRRSSGASVDFRIDPDINPGHAKASPQLSLDRLSVSFAVDQTSMVAFSSQEQLIDSPGFNNFDDEDDEEYSLSAAAILQRQNANKKRPGRRMSRRGSSPYGTPTAGAASTESELRHRVVSIMPSANADTTIPMDELDDVLTDHVTLHKEVIQNTRYQPWDMRHKLRVLRRAKSYVRQHEGALQQRLAEGRTARDLLAQGHLHITKLFKRGRRECQNLVTLLMPWEYRIKEIESHFGSVVASYFTFLRWVFWINVVISVIFAAFVIIPEVLATDWNEPGERKGLLPHEEQTATDLETLWDFEGILKYSPIFYGFYSNRHQTNQGYRLPFAYFLTGLAVYIYSFVAILRKMAHNSRLSKLSDKEDECTFTWKLFTGWDFMIGHPETAANRLASITLGFKEALLEEKEKQKQQERPSRRIIAKRCLANFCVLILLALSVYAVVLVVERSSEPEADSSWWRQNETTVVLSLISLIYPNFFELFGLLEHYHPRRQLRWQLARIMVLNMLNLYTLILALFGKINVMTERLKELKTNISAVRQATLATEFPTMVYSNMTLAPWMENGTTGFFDNYSAGPSWENATLLNTTFLDDFSNYSEWVSVYQGVYDNLTTWDIVANVTSMPCIQILMDCSRKIPQLTTEFTATSVLGLFLGFNFTSLPTPDPVLFRSNTSENSPFLYAHSMELYDKLESKLKILAATNSTSHLQLVQQFLEHHSTPQTNYNPSDHDQGLTELLEKLSQIIHTMKHAKTKGKRSYQSQTMSNELPHEYLSSPESTRLSPEFHEEYDYYDYNDTENTSSERPITSTISTPTSSKENMCYMKVCDGQIKETFDFTTTAAASPQQEISRGSKPACRGDNPQGCTDYWTSSRGQSSPFTASTTRQEPGSFSPKNRQTSMPPVSTTPALDEETRIELRRLCWETMFGQELVKLTVMDLVFTTAFILIIDFIRALLVRILNPCWCWDLEKYFPQYGEFKIAENILHLVNNQGMIWMGMFFSPGLPLINIVKLTILLYVRSWAVLTCNVPHETIFRASRSNNFYLWLLLMMLFLCTLPVAYAIVWLEPSWHCGPFSDYSRMFHILTQSLFNFLPSSLHWVLSYISSPGVVIPLLVLLILVIYYLASLSASLREAATDLRLQLRHERNEERRKNRQKNADIQNQDPAKSQPCLEPQTQEPKTLFPQKVGMQWRSGAPRQPTSTNTEQIPVIPSKLANEAIETKLRPISGSEFPSLIRAQMDGDASDLDISESLLPEDPRATTAAASKKSPAQIDAAVANKKKPSLLNASVHVFPIVTTSPSAVPTAGLGNSSTDIPQIKIITSDGADKSDSSTAPAASAASAPTGGSSLCKDHKKSRVGALSAILQQVKQKRKENSSSSSIASSPSCQKMLDEPVRNVGADSDNEVFED